MGLSDGIHNTWTSPGVSILLSDDTPVPMAEDQVNLLETILIVGAFTAVPLTIYLVDKIGRKRSLLLSAYVSVGSWILIAVANRIEYLYVARYFAGTAGNLAFVSGPMYIAEIAEKKIRGFLGEVIFLMSLLGGVIAYSVIPFVKIYQSSLVCIGLLILMLATFSFAPESPYYLLSRGKNVEALKSLQFLRASQDVEKELEEISIALANQQAETYSPKDLFLKPNNRKAYFILVMLCFGQAFSSFPVQYMNLHLILEEANSTYIGTNTAAIIFAAVLLVVGCTGVFFVDRAGRKVLIISSSTLSGIAMTALAGYFAAKNAGLDVEEYSWLPIASVALFAAFYIFGLGTVPFVLAGELFPADVKALGVSLGDSARSLSILLSLQLYSLLLNNFGIQTPFFVFAACCFITAILSAVIVPETKRKSLDEIQQMLKGLPITPKQPAEASSASI